MKLNLRVNGLTHFELADDEVREAFVREAVGREVVLRQTKFDDAPSVAAIVDDMLVGNVERIGLSLALRALREAKRPLLKGRVVKAEPYMLTVEVEVERLAEEEPAARTLESWAYSGPLMDESADMQQLEYLADVIEERLTDGAAVDDVVRAVEAYSRLAAYDISHEGVKERSQFVSAMESMADERLQAVANGLREMSQRLGGRHGMARVGEWMKYELTSSEEARLMVARSSYTLARSSVVAEAERLPKGLYALWNSDLKLFARTLYNMQPSRADVRRVLSCLVWLDATAEGAASAAGVEVVGAMVDMALEVRDEEMTKNFEVLLARMDDKLNGAYSVHLRRLRRWQAEEQARREGPGRPRRKVFADLMVTAHREERLQTLHALIAGRKGKHVAFVLQTAERLGWLTERPAYESVVEEFGDVGAKSNYTKYIKLAMTEEEKKDFDALFDIG